VEPAKVPAIDIAGKMPWLVGGIHPARSAWLGSLNRFAIGSFAAGLRRGPRARVATTCTARLEGERVYHRRQLLHLIDPGEQPVPLPIWRTTSVSRSSSATSAGRDGRPERRHEV